MRPTASPPETIGRKSKGAALDPPGPAAPDPIRLSPRAAVRTLAAVLGVVLGVAGAPRAMGGCRLQQVAQVPLRDDGGFLSIPASIAGQPVRLMVDTGSDAGLITPQAVGGLGLAADPGAHIRLLGTGGTGRSTAIAQVRGLTIGALRLDDVLMPVGALPGAPHLDPPVVGFLGGDVLSRFDLDIDVRGSTLALYRVSLPSLACAEPPTWKQPFETVPLTAHGMRLSLTVTLDGHRIGALLDTGARSRILSQAAALRIGVSRDTLAADPGGITSGVDMREQVYSWHRFHSLTIGNDTTRSPTLTVAPLYEPFDMLLGTDWLAEREVWISYASQQVFLRSTVVGHTGPR